MQISLTEIGPAIRANLSSQIVESLKNYIIENNLPSGSKLPSERELMTMTKVSRNILREAIKSLESLGILEVKVGDGTYVREYDYTSVIPQMSYALARQGSDLNKLIEARELFEVAALDLVITNIIPSDISHLESVINNIEQANTIEENMQADLEFHTALIEISGNQVVSELCAFLRQFFILATNYARASMIKNDVASHRALLDALSNGNINLAKGLMADHIRRWNVECLTDENHPASEDTQANV